MSITWICQANLGGDEIYPMGKDVCRIRDVCLEMEYGFIPVVVIPFSDDIKIPSDINGSVVFYGATKWIERVNKIERYNGIFFNKASVCSIWSRKYGDKCLNWPNIRTTLGDSLLCEQCELFRQDGMVFVRPDRDNKAFNGKLMSVDDLNNWVDKMSCDKNLLLLEPIIISSPVNIEKEYRLFIIDGKVVSGSLYRVDGELIVDKFVPKYVIDFSEKMAEIYSPSRVFVIDIADVFGGLYVIEVGCFNSAGFYASDIEKIVIGVSNMIEKC